MANTYGQPWPNYPSTLEDEFDLSADQDAQQYQQQPQLTSGYSQDAYSYHQQQLSLNPTSSSSALQGAFRMTPNQYQQSLPATTQTNMSALDHGTYSTQQNHRTHPSIAIGSISNDYQNASNTFNFANSTTRLTNLMPSFPSTSSGHVQNSLLQTLHQDASPFNTNDTNPSPGLPNKRPRSDPHADEGPEMESGGAADHKDGKSKLARACARCKGLKVKCEAKTETEPCKRCFHGGYICVIPGKKIRKAPPKREHLLNQIQSQAKEIDRLMRELERATKRDQRLPDHMEDRIKAVNLSPSTTTSSLFSDPIFKEEGSSSPPSTHSHPNAESNQAVADWLAKAKESLQEFGAFIGLGGAALPQSYLIEDGESESSREDDFVDVEEDLYDDKYEVVIDLPVSDGGDQEMGHALGSAGSVRDESFSTGLGTGNMPVRRRIPSESSKPANLPVEAAPFGLFANLQLKKTKSRENSAEPKEEGDKGTGIANEDFFAATSAPNALGQRLEISQQEWPAIISLGIITPQEAEKLFKIYFDNINLSVSLLDPILYTASRTLLRSPFLFTVICAISSRFYTDRPALYSQTIHYAQAAAGKALISGAKNVEMCFAYILLSLYPVPSRKWEDHRGWLYLGLAIRTATDLNLHLPTTAKPRNENHAREMLNRTRLWINCFNLDRSTGSQYGKPPIINPKDYTANHAENWWRSSPYNLQNFDIHLSAYNSELKVMANFIAKINGNPEHPTGLNKEVDFEAIATETDDEIKALGEKWMKTLAENTDLNDPQNSFRIGLLRLAYSYSRLIALSYGFQHAFGKSDGKDENPFLKRCLQAASDVVHAVDISQPSQVHYWRHGPEAQSVFVTFASAFLVKLLQPKFASYVTQDMRTEIRQLVQSVIDLLGSPAVAIDDRHGPKLYSRFLEKLLNKPMAISPGATSSTPLHTRKLRRAKNSSDAAPAAAPPPPPPAPELSSLFDTSGMMYDQPSPSTTHSLSPPPTSAALSFDQFAPLGGCDPFASSSATQNAINTSEDLSIGDFFSPPLPFDPDIMQSFQSLTDPNEWYDISFPAQFTDFRSNWMTQLQQNMGLNTSTGVYNSS